MKPVVEEPGILADIDDILARYPNARREALIPLLQEVQEKIGYLSREAVRQIAGHLGLPASKIYGVATFYNQFRFQPLGKHHIQLCRGTACHVRGSAGVFDTLKQELKIDSGQTTRDGIFSVEVVACIGACGLAPLVCIDGEFFAEMTPKRLRNLLEEYRDKEQSDE
ncbi:MAG: NADH-quinone oxidoreductase subunit NuoE [Candidatus Hydrogenedentes bacterium]|nr:NADH-quinone oxidoreductase subunit NuoE [Candidatus Hydrogenedentota bacterium]